ncbi:kinesin [Trypanosoma grayi]|uniref:kinesin n=1 Tax=Trypanosoma grayi TaxID=71804 RepID=UPI0004F3F531|nr:kinesin [Trypanosoma grayi]KEG14173.1 kinesin [Trypanosoma grayi]
MGRRIQVEVRLRPGEGGASCVGVEGIDSQDVVVADLTGTHASSVPRNFHVDRVISQGCSNEELFRTLVLNRVLSSIDEPDTSCFLAYGHTNSGKTHTIAGSEQEPGLLTLSTKAVLDVHGVAEVAMLEVYGETVHDLLAQGERRQIRRRAGPDGTVIVVENLTTCSITSMEEWRAVAEFGMKTRRTAPTERNSRSSRSHAIFTIKSRGLRLCLVDLAGSERQTTYSPQLNKESIAINKSLSRLSTVLEALSATRVKADGTASYVNFRDTTLTVLLQRYLSGASMTVFLACIHPDAQFYHETMSTMRYTQRLKRIHTKAPPQKPSEDMSLFHPGEKQDLLAELLLLRKIVGEQQQRQQQQNPHYSSSFKTVVEQALNGRLDQSPLSGCSLPTRGSPSQEGTEKTTSPGADHRQRLLRSKDTKRVAGWLLSRILGELPELSVGFDDYFDPYLPPQVQVVGYASLMACLAPRDKNESGDNLAFLDVGDIAMGLSMLDAGIPACVGLHRLNCSASESWEAHEYDETNKVFVLAFFEISEELVETMGTARDSFECCGGLLTLEPLVPLAVVLCTPLNASDELKENILQHLVTLQGEQEGMLEDAMHDAPLSSPPMNEDTSLTDSARRLSASALLEITLKRGNVGDEKGVTSSSDSIGSPAAPLAEEIERQAQNQPQLRSPLQVMPLLFSGDGALGLPPESSSHHPVRAFVISSSSYSSSFSSSASSSDNEEMGVAVPAVEQDPQAAPLEGLLRLPVQSVDNDSDSDTESESKVGTPESIDDRISSSGSNRRGGEGGDSGGGGGGGDNDNDDDDGGGSSVGGVAVSPADVRFRALATGALPPHAEVSRYPAHGSTSDAVDSQRTLSDRSQEDYTDHFCTTPFSFPLPPPPPPANVAAASFTAPPSLPAGQTVEDTRDKKKKKKSHRRRLPVMQGCHGCAVI